ncbi:MULTISPECIES: cation:proton antiporter [Fusobacterium]|uniref:cation:proton antiporter n=1 Tax=Fusobacterium TaxID=848 RepID=UPI001F454CEA|nr:MULTISPECIES: cation:proton antiporter [Fusobacterium]MCF2611824.1 cation:proton antiporter [Fusobacterium perfoetens]MDY2981438.1 cation:proton antiporter [Fusobacterium sp.]
MLFSFAFFILIAIGLSKLFEKLRLPGLLGMILTGIILGEYSKNYIVNILKLDFLEPFFISDKILSISSDLRLCALIVILIRAGLGIDRVSLKKIGNVALKMACIPCLFEGFTIMIITHLLLGFPLPICGTLGFIIAAVSPAVVVPEMLSLKEKNLGKEKEIPTLILAGASIDDIFAITLFSSFLSLSLGKNVNIYKEFLKIPLSIVIGIVLGGVIGIILVKFFKKYHIRDTRKAIIFLMVGITFHQLESLNIFPIASLLGIMTMGFIILEKYPILAKRLSTKFNKIWVFSEIILFVLIGAAVNIKVIFSSSSVGVIIVLIGLVGRMLGVGVSLFGSNLNKKERLFCGLSYIPKATVQAAISGIPLAMGVPHGEILLAIGVLSIVLSVPVGVIGIRIGQNKLLK